MSFQYLDSLLGDARTRYDKKLSFIGLSECPYRLPQGSWSNDPTRWPEMEYGDMYAYLIETPGTCVYILNSCISFNSIFLNLLEEYGILVVYKLYICDGTLESIIYVISF